MRPPVSLPLVALAFAAVTSIAKGAHGADGPRELSHDTRIDGAITATGALWLIVSESLKPRLVPEKCRWCYRAADGKDTLNPVDSAIRRGLKWKATRTADVTSSVIVFMAEPVVQLGLVAG